MRRSFFVLFVLLQNLWIWSQFQPENGLKESQVDKIAITHVDVLVRPGVKVKDATVLISGTELDSLMENTPLNTQSTCKQPGRNGKVTSRFGFEDLA